MDFPAPLNECQAITGTDFRPQRFIFFVWFGAYQVPFRQKTKKRPHSSVLFIKQEIGKNIDKRHILLEKLTQKSFRH
jgi:hypothetical protein